MSPGTWLSRGRLQVEHTLARLGRLHTFSLARFLLHRRVAELIDREARGSCLDIGAGMSPFRDRLLTRAEGVTVVDVEKRGAGVDLLADVQDMPKVASESFDTVLCTQVLEHVARPWDALVELRRVLRPAGRLILSVPHLSAIHEAPTDYYRYTRYGLEFLLRQADFEVAEIHPAGGWVAFLAHGVSYLLLSVTGTVPYLAGLARLFNYLALVRLLEPIDRLLGARARYPNNYVVLARRA